METFIVIWDIKHEIKAYKQAYGIFHNVACGLIAVHLGNVQYMTLAIFIASQVF